MFAELKKYRRYRSGLITRGLVLPNGSVMYRLLMKGDLFVGRYGPTRDSCHGRSGLFSSTFGFLKGLFARLEYLNGGP